MKNTCEKRAEKTKEFIKTIRSEIVVPVMSFVKKEREKCKELYDNLYKTENPYCNLKQKLEDAKKKYLDQHREFENFVEECEIAAAKKEYKSVNQPQIIESLYNLYLKTKEMENMYKTIYNDAKEARSMHAVNSKNYLNLKQKLQRQLIENIKDKVTSYYTRKIQEALELTKIFESNQEVIKKDFPSEPNIEKLNNNNDEKEEDSESELVFVRAKTKHAKLYEFFDKVNYEKMPLSSVANLDLANLSKKKSEALPNPCVILLNNCWSAKKTDLATVEAFKKTITTEEGRNEFCDAFNHWRSKGIFSISSKGYEALGDVLMQVLDEASKAKDVETVMRILILSQTYYTKSEKGHKSYLQKYIQGHEIWTREMWEKAIRKGIEEEKNSSPTSAAKTREDVLQTENTIYAKLGSIANNMLEFGMDYLEVKKIIIGYGKKYINNAMLVAELEVLLNAIVGYVGGDIGEVV